MIDIQQNLTYVNFTDRNDTTRIKYIVVHYFGALGSAKNTCAYFKNTYRGASAHYFVDNTSIWQCVLDEDISWHCGDSGVGTEKWKCTNSNSIGIETRPYKLNPNHISAADTDWYFEEETEENLLDLVKMLMKKYNVPAENVIRHYDVTAKWCPRCWMGDDINTYYGITGNQKWAEFKQKLVEEEEEVTQTQFNEMMSVYLNELGTQEPSTWSAEARTWAEGNGIIKGDQYGNKKYKDFCTREEMVIFLQRTFQLSMQEVENILNEEE